MKDKKEGAWKDWIPVAVTLLAIALAVFIFNQGSFLSSETNKNILAENADITSNISIGYTPRTTGKDTNITDSDTKFKNWMATSFSVINKDLSCVSKAGKNRNFTETERCGKFLKENSNMYLERIDEYNVSASLRAVLDEYKDALEDYRAGGINLETGARNGDVLQISDGTKYIQNGNVHISRVDSILYENTYGNISNSIGV